MDDPLLKKLISIPSIYPDEESLSNFISQWVDKNTTCKIKKQQVTKNRNNLLISKGKGKRVILLSGHLDTVPAAIGWKTNPFSPQIKGDRLYGLGAWDMKSGLYILLQCLKKLDPTNTTIKVAISVDEENYSVGVHKIIDSGFCDDANFILVPEPGFIHGDKGLSLGRAGRATFTVKIRGVSAHGSYPNQGINAIDQAQIFLRHIQGLSFATHKKLGNTEIYPRFIHSEAKGFSVPDECLIEIDSKLVVPDTPKLILDKLSTFSQKLYRDKQLAFAPTVSFKERPTPFCAPYEISKNNQYAKLCQKVLDSVVGKSIPFYRDSVADECVFYERLKIPTFTLGPSGSNAHSANEYVELDSVSRVEKVYLKILRDFDSLKANQ